MPNYNYQNCVINSLIRKIGCKPFWLNSTSVAFPVCQKAQDLIRFQETTKKTYFPPDKKSFYHKTGCLIPCKYKEYQIESVERRSKPKNDG